jgi:hypothetical protein
MLHKNSAGENTVEVVWEDVSKIYPLKLTVH